MRIAQAIIDQITKSVARQVVKDIAPVVTVAVENALVRRGRPAARYEADALAATAAAFCNTWNKKRGTHVAAVGDSMSYSFDMYDLSLLRQLQQAVDAYKERIKNGDN